MRAANNRKALAADWGCLLFSRMGLVETAVTVDGLRADIDVLKARTASGAAVTDVQASQISQAVKAVAVALGKQTGRNEFGACYGELYRKFGTTSYKLVQSSQFDSVMAWLNEGDGSDIPPKRQLASDKVFTCYAY